MNIAYDSTGRFNRSLLKKTIPDLTETELEMIIREKEKCYNDFLSETHLNSKIADILYKYFKTNKTVLVTNCREDRALATLNYHGLSEMFSDLFFFRQFEDNMRFNKFQNAISTLDISPKLIIASENEKIEIADAEEARIQYVNPQIS